MIVQFFGDPVCPWTWITSRWLQVVATARGFTIRWRTFSLAQRDGGELSAAIPPEIRENARASRALSSDVVRVFEATRENVGEDAVGHLYTALGCRLFVPNRPPTMPLPTVLHDAIVASGLDPSLERAAAVERWDEKVQASMNEALSAVGADALSPVVVIDNGSRCALAGPVLSPTPSGDAALRVWDAVVQLAAEPAFFELRRTRQRPTFPTCQ